MNNSLEYKEIRGWILRVLYNNLPEWVGDKLMTEILTQGGYKVNTPSVQGHFRYLEEKGYLEVKETEISELGLARTLAKLTSKGVDLVEGNLPDDPGIERK
ncbi:MAG: hypothetical protein ACM3ZC_15465 [Bacteroidota bacterium]